LGADAFASSFLAAIIGLLLPWSHAHQKFIEVPRHIHRSSQTPDIIIEAPMHIHVVQTSKRTWPFSSGSSSSRTRRSAFLLVGMAYKFDIGFGHFDI
jgi:hypothetical protein